MRPNTHGALLCVIVLAMAAGCSISPGDPGGTVTQPTGESVVTVTEATGKVEILRKGGSTIPLARVGDVLHQGDILSWDSKSSAAVSIPGGSSMRLGGSVGLELTPAGGDFWFSGMRTNPNLELTATANGSTDTNLKGGSLTLHTGAAVVKAIGPARFTTIARASNHADVTIRVVSGTVTGVGEGGGLTLSAGQEGVIPAPRSNAPGPTPYLVTPRPTAR